VVLRRVDESDLVSRSNEVGPGDAADGARADDGEAHRSDSTDGGDRPAVAAALLSSPAA